MGEPGFDVVVVSPHPDDAVLSAGGAIARAVREGLRVAVVTVFGRTAEATEERRAEDEAALAALGATRVALDLAEAPARDGAYRRPWRLFAPLDGREGALVEAVRAAVRAVAGAAATVVGPLGVGEHVDHQVAHAACASLARERAGAGAGAGSRPASGEVRFYEDVPYALRRLAVEARLARVTGEAPAPSWSARIVAGARFWNGLPLVEDEWSPIARPIALAALVSGERMRRVAEPLRLAPALVDVGGTLDAQLAAIAAYATQWPLFFRSLDDCRRVLVGRCAALGSPVPVERQWRSVTT